MKVSITLILIILTLTSLTAQQNSVKVKNGSIIIEHLNQEELNTRIDIAFEQAKKDEKIAETWIKTDYPNLFKSLSKEYEIINKSLLKNNINFRVLNSQKFQQEKEKISETTFLLQPEIIFYEHGSGLVMALTFTVSNQQNKIIFNEGAKRLIKQIRKE